MRSPTNQTYRTIGLALVVLAALGLIALAGRGGSGEFQSTARSPDNSTVTPTPDERTVNNGETGPDVEDEPIGLPLKILFWIMVAVAAVGAVVLVMMFPRGRNMGWFRRWRYHTGAGGFGSGELVADIGDDLTAAVDEGLRAMDEGSPTDAIIACWMRLEEAAASAGTVRRPHETSAELTARVLAAHAVSTRPLARLADLYREARFSGHRMTEPDRSEARTTLDRLRDELTGRPVGGGAL